MEELFFNVLLSVIEYPGVFIHWLLRKEQMPFRAIVKKHYFINLALSLFIYGMVLAALA